MSRSKTERSFKAPSDPNHRINRRRRRVERERGPRPVPRRRGAGRGGGGGRRPPGPPKAGAGSPRRPFRSPLQKGKDIIREGQRSGNFGRMNQRLRRLGPLLRLNEYLQLLDLLEQFLPMGRLPWGGQRPNPAAGWRFGSKCNSRSTVDWKDSAAGNGGPSHPWFGFAQSCLSGQAGGSGLSGAVPDTHGNLFLADQYEVVPGLNRYRVVQYWYRNRDNLTPAQKAAPDFVRTWFDMADPNTIRWLPGFAEPLPDVHPDEGTDLVPQMETRLGTRNAPVIAPEPAPMSRQRQHIRGVTDSAVRERKALSRSAKLGILLAKWVDHASEAAEVVDAVYEALPDDVRKAWEKKQGAHWVRDPKTGKWRWHVPTRPGDQYGQYGVDGADWKLRAIWYNYDKIDVEAALLNIAKNHLSDSVIGRIKRGLPRQTGAALEDADKAFAKWLDDVLSWALEQV